MRLLTKILMIPTMGILFASPSDWIDEPGAYEFTATISGGILLSDGVNMAEEGDMFGAFDENGNVRGVAVQLSPPFGPYEGEIIYEMQLRSNATGDLLSFKYYDASEDAVFDIVDTYAFEINDIIGSVVEPEFYTTEFANLSFANPTSSSVLISYSSNTAIAGFQFNVNGVTLSSASGGDAEAAGFSLSCSATTCVGFAFDQATIPAGSGTLLELEFTESSEDQALQISDVLISDSDGNIIQSSGPGSLPLLFTYNASTQQAFYLISSVTINGQAVESEDWVGAFNGDVCVGSRKWDTSQCGSGICDLPVMGDQGVDFTEGYMLPGDEPIYKIYDASENIYYDAVPSENFPWSNMGFHPIDNLESGDVWDGSADCANDESLIVPFTCAQAVASFGCEFMWGSVTIGEACPEDCGLCDDGGDIAGCMDNFACNYNTDATVDDGSCDYAEVNYDCDGNCIVEIDCSGDCGGSAEFDE